jgi:uncharacterized protein YndB with AHSA1/START domain
LAVAAALRRRRAKEGSEPMTEGTCPPVSVSRTIEVPAENLFDFLARPANHPLVDGSGMLREGSGGVISGVGDVFTMKMHNDEMGDYEMSNHVVEYEPNHRIGWEPVLKAASRPEDQGEIGDRSEHRWTYELTPVDSRSTLVTETYDCSRAPEWLRNAVKGGTRWIGSMTATLQKLDAFMTAR